MDPVLVDILNQDTVGSIFSEESFVNAVFTVGLLTAISFAIAMGVIAGGYWTIQWLTNRTRPDGLNKYSMEQIATYRPSSFDGKRKRSRPLTTKPHAL